MHAFNFWQKYFIAHFWKHEEIPFAVALFWQPYHFTLLRWFCTKENAFLFKITFPLKCKICGYDFEAKKIGWTWKMEYDFWT